MYAQVEKPKENSFPTNRQESRAVANSVAQRKSEVKQGFGFVDNRPESIAQQTVQKIMNDCSQQNSRDFRNRQSVQRYTTDVDGKLSQQHLYHVNPDDETHLYVLPGSAPPAPAGSFEQHGNRFGYQGYRFNIDAGFENDCLNFAEELALRIAERDRVEGRHGEFRAVENRDEGGANRVFGSSDNQNRQIGRGVSSNHGMEVQDGHFNQEADASPNLGQAYATVRKQEEDGAPYHAATVVAIDDNDRVTLEADAGQDLDRPIFDIYGVPNPDGDVQGETFHGTHAGGFGDDPATGVLDLRND